MKTKFFMLLAAVLLGSVSAFAQSGNNNPAKGDVNEDGMVDVADINAILKIMKDGGGPVAVGGYFYLGTTEPTAANYKSLPGAVTTFTSIDDAVGTTASVAAGETLYMLCPAAWVTEKNMALEDKSGNTIDFLDEIDAATISGHVIYKTQVWNAPNDVVLKTKQASTTYYYYAGTTKPTSLSQVSTVTSYPAETTYTNNSGAKSHIFVLTNSNKSVTFIEPSLNAPITQKDVDTTTISGYKIFETAVGVANTGTVKIQISETNTYYFGTLTESQLANQTTVNNLAYNKSGNKPSTLTVPSGYPTQEGSYLVFMYPSSWGTPTIKSVNGFGTGNMSASDAGINNPSNKVITFWDGHGITANTVFNIVWNAPNDVAYYYYAGWTQPTASNVDTIIAETYPAESGSTTIHTAGKKTTSKSTMDYTSNTLYNANAKATYYVLVPTGHAIYDSLNNNVIASTFTSKGNITVGGQTHTVYASNGTSRNIGAIIIK